MPLPARPTKVAELDLMKRLKAYGDGSATWHENEQALGDGERHACTQLLGALVAFIEKCLHPLMDRVTAREMQHFTMHDAAHGLKVAHLMWHIITPERRDTLSPAEIALLVLAAHIHDLGMGLSDEERKARLAEGSDLWDKVDTNAYYVKAMHALQALAARDDVASATKAQALMQANQAQETLLCNDSRERHATPGRYAEILATLEAMHVQRPGPNPRPGGGAQLRRRVVS